MKPEEQELKELRILAVDDEESNLLLIWRILERAGYTHVETTTDASRVPDMFVETCRDLDQARLEILNRLALAAEYRPTTAAIPVVVSADATSAQIERLRAGAAKYLTKPIDVESLLGTVTGALSATATR